MSDDNEYIYDLYSLTSFTGEDFNFQAVVNNTEKTIALSIEATNTKEVPNEGVAYTRMWLTLGEVKTLRKILKDALILKEKSK